MTLLYEIRYSLLRCLTMAFCRCVPPFRSNTLFPSSELTLEDVAPKLWYSSTRLHGVITKETTVRKLADLKISNIVPVHTFSSKITIF
jgi:hypothetical protein